jgi:aldehyde dehydrogenase (NAD+)
MIAAGRRPVPTIWIMQQVLEKLSLTEDNPGVFDGEWRGGGANIDKISPIDGRRLASIRTASDDDYNKAIARAHDAFLKWRVTPGPVRGETVRRLGNALRELKQERSLQKAKAKCRR